MNRKELREAITLIILLRDNTKTPQSVADKIMELIPDYHSAIEFLLANCDFYTREELEKVQWDANKIKGLVSEYYNNSLILNYLNALPPKPDEL